MSPFPRRKGPSGGGGSEMLETGMSPSPPLTGQVRPGTGMSPFHRNEGPSGGGGWLGTGMSPFPLQEGPSGGG